MAYDPLEHHPPKRWRTGRRSYRLQGYDYSSEGAYYVTICVRNRQCVLGDVVNGEMRLSVIGEIVRECWLGIPDHFSNVTLDEFQVMPNHLHGIVVSCGNHRRDLIDQIPTGSNPQSQTDYRIPTENDNTIPLGIDESHFGPQTNFPLMKNPKQVLGKILRHFKARATKMIHDQGFPDFQWQGKFHDHIIRDEADLERIREYIRNNPLNWAADEENAGKLD